MCFAMNISIIMFKCPGLVRLRKARREPETMLFLFQKMNASHYIIATKRAPIMNVDYPTHTFSEQMTTPVSSQM